MECCEVYSHRSICRLQGPMKKTIPWLEKCSVTYGSISILWTAAARMSSSLLLTGRDYLDLELGLRLLACVDFLVLQSTKEESLSLTITTELTMGVAKVYFLWKEPITYCGMCFSYNNLCTMWTSAHNKNLKIVVLNIVTRNQYDSDDIGSGHSFICRVFPV